MKKLTTKQWAIVATAATILIGIINAIVGRPAVLDTIVGLFGITAIILWIIFAVQRRKDRPKPARPAASNTAKGSRRIVSVVFKELTDSRLRDSEHGYAYIWSLGSEPELGTRVVVPGSDGPAYAVIVGIDTEPPAGIELAIIQRLVTDEEFDNAREASDASQEQWLTMARHAARLPTDGPMPPAVPEGHPDIAPTDGNASSADADRYGRMWWRAYKQSEGAGRDPDEAARFRSIAHRWFSIRDQGK